VILPDCHVEQTACLAPPLRVHNNKLFYGPENLLTLSRSADATVLISRGESINKVLQPDLDQNLIPKPVRLYVTSSHDLFFDANASFSAILDRFSSIRCFHDIIGTVSPTWPSMMIPAVFLSNPLVVVIMNGNTLTNTLDNLSSFLRV
jgi:hypothetical protein